MPDLTMRDEHFEALNKVSTELVKLTMCQLNITERRIVETVRREIEAIRKDEMITRNLELNKQKREGE